MASRALFGGQAPEYKIDHTVPTSVQDGFPLGWVDDDKKVGFMSQPTIGINALGGSSTVTFSEIAGTGVCDDGAISGFTIRIGPSAYVHRLLFSGSIGTTSNLSGGGTALACALPAALAGSAVDAYVGVVFVEDTVGLALCAAKVNGIILTLERASGTFAAGSVCSVKPFEITYATGG